MTDRLVTTLLEIARLNGSSASNDIQDAQELARLALEELGIDVDNPPELITEEMKEKAIECPTLGPAYFASQRIAKKLAGKLHEEPFKGLLKEFSDKFLDELQTKLEDHLFCDVETNVQSKIWHMVDQIVRGLLSGEKWVVDRYALGSKYDCENIRSELVKHIPKEVQDLQIKELGDQVERLANDIKFYRSR
jgi:uncharacterized protein (UPF0297 family)